MAYLLLNKLKYTYRLFDVTTNRNLIYKCIQPLIGNHNHRYFHPKTNDSPVRVRFAPSPTGEMHLGGLRTALYNYLFAKSHSGDFILRIEDTDRARLVPGATEKLSQILNWIGLQPDEGPDHGGKYGPYIQSERLNIYHDKIDELVASGHAYPCFCSEKRLDLIRKDAMRRGEIPKYDNKCRHLSKDEVRRRTDEKQKCVVRFKLNPVENPWYDLIHGPITQNVATVEGDPIILKSDGYPTYHFACVVDDHMMQISHVLRGVEWQSSTMKHILLHQAFGWTPPEFAHLPLLVDSNGKKLSKRHGDIGIGHLQEQGYYPESIVSLLTLAGGGFGNTDTSGKTIKELISEFSLQQVSASSGRLQIERLDELNRVHLKRRLISCPAELVQKLGEMINCADSHFYHMNDDDKREYLTQALKWGQDRINKVDDLLGPGFKFLWMTTSLDPDNLSKVDINKADAIRKTMQRIMGAKTMDTSEIGPVLKTLVNESGYKMATYMRLIRLALCGLSQGPPVAELVQLLGKNEVLKRLDTCEKFILDRGL